MNRRSFVKALMVASIAPTVGVDMVLADDEDTTEDDDEDP